MRGPPERTQKPLAIQVDSPIPVLPGRMRVIRPHCRWCSRHCDPVTLSGVHNYDLFFECTRADCRGVAVRRYRRPLLELLRDRAAIGSPPFAQVSLGRAYPAPGKRVVPAPDWRGWKKLWRKRRPKGPRTKRRTSARPIRKPRRRKR